MADRGFGHGHGAGREVIALFRIKPRDFLAFTRHGEVTAHSRVVLTAHFLRAVKDKAVTGNRHLFAHVHAHIAFGRVALHKSHTDHKNGHAQVRELHAPESTRMTEKFRKETALHVAAAVDDVVDHGNGNPNRKRHADKDPVAPASHEERHHGGNHNGRGKAPPELLGKRKRIGFLPAGKRSHAQKE